MRCCDLNDATDLLFSPGQPDGLEAVHFVLYGRNRNILGPWERQSLVSLRNYNSAGHRRVLTGSRARPTVMNDLFKGCILGECKRGKKNHQSPQPTKAFLLNPRVFLWTKKKEEIKSILPLGWLNCLRTSFCQCCRAKWLHSTRKSDAMVLWARVCWKTCIESKPDMNKVLQINNVSHILYLHFAFAVCFCKMYEFIHIICCQST